ncbi:hypothetical protein D3C72_538950 [compost metagenome]
MRKVILLCVATILAVACKSASVATAPAASTKLDKSAQVGIKGNWQITDVTYPGSQYIKVTSFNVADSKCFIGSTWSFISNNNKGTMALTQSGCPAFNSSITWYINEEGKFVMKILDEGLKSKKVTTGFVLGIANQTETSFQLIDKINVGGKLTDVVYQFQKTN